MLGSLSDGPVRSNYVRLARSPSSGALELQTAMVRLALRDPASGDAFSVDLLSTVHVADASYYAELQAICESEYDRVLFELIVDDSLVGSEADGATGRTVRRLSAPLRASPGLQALADRNGLATQVESLDCCRPQWVLADVSKRQLTVQEARLQTPGLALGRNTLAPGFGGLAMPLRLLIVGPTGGGGALRPLLSLLPAPEVCLLLDDWVSSGGAAPAPTLRALAAALGRLDLAAARQLSFAQTLAAGETTQEGSLSGSLVRWRNARAVAEVEGALEAGKSRLALLYGALHMRDLRARLLQNYELVSVG